jgi:hypothetical protein
MKTQGLAEKRNGWKERKEKRGEGRKRPDGKKWYDGTNQVYKPGSVSSFVVGVKEYVRSSVVDQARGMGMLGGCWIVRW